ncbi:MAG: YkgJ family cysteine cluster protein [Sedimentisphaerales bacterium]|nr:YkgJ family cysteine cluster protein [Sedimentisphaerales bacterium]
MESDPDSLDIQSLPVEVANQIAHEVETIYQWIDEQIRFYSISDEEGCLACGKCCDFETYDHRLFVTTPELVYFLTHIGLDNLRAMTSGICPYLDNGKCSIHVHRFAGCRIYLCKNTLSSQLQGQFSEESIRRFKAICHIHDLPYRYCDLKTALNQLTKGRPGN